MGSCRCSVWCHLTSCGGSAGRPRPAPLPPPQRRPHPPIPTACRVRVDPILRCHCPTSGHLAKTAPASIPPTTSGASAVDGGVASSPRSPARAPCCRPALRHRVRPGGQRRPVVAGAQQFAPCPKANRIGRCGRRYCGNQPNRMASGDDASTVSSTARTTRGSPTTVACHLQVARGAPADHRREGRPAAATTRSGSAAWLESSSTPLTERTSPDGHEPASSCSRRGRLSGTGVRSHRTSPQPEFDRSDHRQAVLHGARRGARTTARSPWPTARTTVQGLRQAEVLQEAFVAKETDVGKGGWCRGVRESGGFWP